MRPEITRLAETDLMPPPPPDKALGRGSGKDRPTYSHRYYPGAGIIGNVTSLWRCYTKDVSGQTTSLCDIPLRGINTNVTYCCVEGAWVRNNESKRDVDFQALDPTQNLLKVYFPPRSRRRTSSRRRWLTELRLTPIPEDIAVVWSIRFQSFTYHPLPPTMTMSSS